MTTLVRALDLQPARLISLCGAGGKTTLMFALAREFVAAGERVLISTTTRIARTEAQGWLSFAASGTAQVLNVARHLLPASAPAGAVIAHAGLSVDGCKLIGHAPEFVDALAQTGAFDRILVEADGSARKSLKAPAAHEPVIPSTTQALLIVAGLSGLGLPLREETLCRAAVWSRLSGLALGAPVSATSLARSVIHADGFAYRGPAAARTILFLNQADTAVRLAQAQQVVRWLAAAPGHRVERVAVGCLRPQPDIAEVMSLQRSVAAC